MGGWVGEVESRGDGGVGGWREGVDRWGVEGKSRRVEGWRGYVCVHACVHL